MGVVSHKKTATTTTMEEDRDENQHWNLRCANAISYDNVKLLLLFDIISSDRLLREEKMEWNLIFFFSFSILKNRERTRQCTKASRAWRTIWWPSKRFDWNTKKERPARLFAKSLYSKTCVTLTSVRLPSFLSFLLSFPSAFSFTLYSWQSINDVASLPPCLWKEEDAIIDPSDPP